MAKRKTELVLVAGINGTGKTTWLNEEVLKKSKKSLVVTSHETEWAELPLVKTKKEIYDLSGHARILYDGPETLKKITHFHGGSLILDDARMFLSKHTEGEIRNIYISRRQIAVDIYMSAHGLRQIPIECFSYASWLILFNTSENFSGRKNELLPELYQLIIETQQRIKKKVLAGNPYYHEIILLDAQIQSIYESNRKNNR